MALILDRTTGLVSPQFHVTFDPSFRTVKQDKFDIQSQAKTGFLINNKDRERTRSPDSDSIYKNPSILSEQERSRNKSKKRTKANDKLSKPE